nr:MAG TPA: stabilization protein [Caudoviricetes sp.]DAK00510.1 MAG TPA: stabilization protein [Caudoviricetes sp.]
MKSATLARLAQPARARRAQTLSLPAPIGGWYTAGNLDAMPAGTAFRLENWRPTTTGIAQRGGSRKHATLTNGSAPVVSFIPYNATQKKLFAATRAEVYDITTVANPGVIPGSPVLSGQTSGYYSFNTFTTSGGEFLTIVNGADPLRLYDPVNNWRQITTASTPAITGVPSTAELSFVWPYRNRQFFIGRGMFAYCLPVGTVTGALTKIDLNGVFQRGGRLLFGASWSLDAGDGLDDKCVFVTTEGEIAVYEGADPANAATWSLVGRYDMADPLGPRASMRSGGELLIATEIGLLPLSKAINQDIAALEQSALSKAISPDWRRAARDRRALPWEIVKYPDLSYAIFCLPAANANQQGLCYVMNTETGAWSSYTGWDARCMAVHDGSLYFGTRDGKVFQAEAGGKDDGKPIYYTCIANPDHLQWPGVVKTLLLAQAKFKAATPYETQLTASTDNETELPAAPNAAPDSGLGSSYWGTGLWNRALWDAAVATAGISAVREAIGRTGYVFQWQLQITGAQTTYPVVELISMNLSFEAGQPLL